MLSNLKKINNEFDKKLELLSFRNLKNLFKKRRSKVKIDEESNNENKKYIDFQIKVSSEVIELRKMLEESIKNTKMDSNFDGECNEEKNPNDEKKIQLLNFIKENTNENCKIPKNIEILDSVNISKWELRVLKNELVNEGYLEKLNERLYVLKSLKSTNL